MNYAHTFNASGVSVIFVISIKRKCRPYIHIAPYSMKQTWAPNKLQLSDRLVETVQIWKLNDVIFVCLL